MSPNRVQIHPGYCFSSIRMLRCWRWKKKWAIRTLKILDGMICTSRRDPVDARQRGKPVMLRFCCLVKATLVPRFARNGPHVVKGRKRPPQDFFKRALLSGKKTDMES